MQRIALMMPVALVLACAGCVTSPWLRPERKQTLPPPWNLSPEEQAQVDEVLRRREEQNADHQTVAWNFTRWEYDFVFGERNKPRSVDEGEMAFAASGKGKYCVGANRPERWMWDEQALFQYDYQGARLIEHRLPANLRGKLLDFGPCPLLLCTQAAKLKQLYYLRVTTPREAKAQVWLEAYPRFAEDAVWFERAELILTTPDMQPVAIQVYSQRGAGRTVYALHSIQVDDPLLLESGALCPVTPPSWKRIVSECPSELPGSDPTPASPQ